jgi:hypothetical protein
MVSGAAGAGTALALHGAGLDHGDIRLSIGAGVLAAIPVLSGTLPRIVWAVVFALYAVLTAVLGIPYVILRMKDPADYFPRALGAFTNSYYAYSSSTPWSPHDAQDTAATSPPGPHGLVRVTVPQPAVQRPAFIPRQPAPGPGITAGQLNVVRELDKTPARVEVPREARRGQRGRHVA